jgi:hypothetical protein
VSVVVALFLLGLIIRFVTPSPDITVRTGINSFFMDNAGFLAWSREVAESSSLGVTGELLSNLRTGNQQRVAEALLRDPGNLTGAVVYGLYDNPERVTRLLDVFALALWFRIVGYSEAKAEALMVLISAASVVAVYLLAWLTWHDRRTAALSALLMAILPGSVESGRWVSWHVFGQLTFTLAVVYALWALSAYRERGGWRYPLIAGAVWGACLYSNTLLPFLIPLALAPTVFYTHREMRSRSAEAREAQDPPSSMERKSLLRAATVYLATGIVVFFPGLSFVALRWPRFVERNLDTYATAYSSASVVLDKLGAMLHHWFDAATLPIVVLGALGIWASGHSRRAATYVPVAWLAVYALFSATLGAPHLQRRVGLSVFPPLVLLAAAAVVVIWDWSAGRWPAARARWLSASALVALVCFLGLPTVRYSRSGVTTTPLRAAIEAVASHLEPGAVVITNRVEGMKVLGPPLRTYTVISAVSLVRRSEEGTPVSEYLAWRFPTLSWPVTQLHVLLDLEGEPDLREADVLETVSQAFLSERVTSQPAQVTEYGRGLRVYTYSAGS